MDDVEKLLEYYKPLINQSLEKVLPRKITQEFIKKNIGSSRYEFDLNALQESIADPIWDLLDRGGKRWRPILFLLIIDLLGKSPKDYVDLSVIFELIHNATLIIDDLEDSSEMRRGKPATYLIYGIDIAVNAGNTLYYLPLKVLDSYKDKLDKETLLKVHQVYFQEMLNLGLGQATDITWHKGLISDQEITINQYLQMCAFKTGCLSRMAAKVGAIVGGGDEKKVEALGLLGESLGVVFQIQDDILNITENELSKGKGVGEDITEGKRSLPIIYALNSLPEDKAKRLIEILKMHTNDQTLRNEAIALINEADAVSKAQKTMRELFDKALNDLDPLLEESEKKKSLYQLAGFLVSRSV